MLQPNKKIKVLYIQAPPGGGSVIALCEMLKKIDPQVIEPLVLCYYKTPHTQLLEKASRGKINYLFPEYTTNLKTVSTFPSMSLLNKIWRIIENEYVAFKNYFFPQNNLLQKITAAVRSFSPDIIHHNNDISVDRVSIRACNKFNIPQIVHNRSIAVYKQISFNYFVDNYLHKKIAYNINITEAVRNNYQKLFNTSPSHAGVLHDFVDEKKFSPTRPDTSLISEFGLTKNDFVVGDIGRIISWKGQHILIEALNIIKTIVPNVKVLIVGPYDNGVGSEDYFTHLKLLVKKYDLLNSVIFTGNRNDIPKIINICQIIAHTAIKPEPQGLIIIEALLCKKTVIVANAGGAAEIAFKYGGILVTPGNQIELAAAIINCWEKHSKGGLSPKTDNAKLLGDFNGAAQIEKILSIYTSVIGNN